MCGSNWTRNQDDRTIKSSKDPHWSTSGGHIVFTVWDLPKFILYLPYALGLLRGYQPLYKELHQHGENALQKST